MRERAGPGAGYWAYAEGKKLAWTTRGKGGPPGMKRKGGWADWVAGFSWVWQVGPSAGFGLGFQSGLGWALLEFWVGWVSSFSFLFSF